MFHHKRGLVLFKKKRVWGWFFVGFLSFGFVFLGNPQSAWALTFTVNSTEDSNDGTCTNPYVDSSSDCTMREAINASNVAPGADTIQISITSSDFNSTSDGHGQWTSTVSSAYNALSGEVTIDASGMWDADENRPGFRLYSTNTTIAALTFGSGAANSKVKALEIQGYNAGMNVGLAASGVVIGTDCDGTNDGSERNVIHGATSHGIRIQSSNSVVAGNYIGVNDDGLSVTGSTIYGIWISGSGADNNTLGFREGLTCTVSQQRNIVGGTITSNGSGIRVEGGGIINLNGDESLAPSGTRISGNYIGVGADGSTRISIIGSGIHLVANTTQTIIGTDGDGTADSSERNIISGSASGVLVTQTGTNRISGNYVGLNASGTAAVANNNHGLAIRGGSNIVGWCDTSVHASLCSNSGSLADQRNVISGNTQDGIRIGYQGTNSSIFGNYIGTAADGTITIANGDSGVFVHRGNTGNSIGGSTSNHSNLIQGNEYGVKLDGEFIGSGGRGDPAGQIPVQNNTIQNNTIQQNGTGILHYWTENYSTDGPTDNTLTVNTISSNTDYGIDVYGSSPAITNNTITNNGNYGIYIHPALVTYDADTEATTTDGGNPTKAANNLISRPIITGNSVSGNSTGGIYQIDSRASNYTTLATDNAIGSNNSQFDIRQDWYGAVEILDRNGSPIPSTALATTSAKVSPSAGGSSSTLSASSTTSYNSFTQNIFGSSGVSYTDVSTWPVLTEYVIDVNGNQTNYGPYSLSASGTYTSTGSYTYTFDGSNNDTSYSNALPNGISTDSQYRYQIGKVLTSTLPSTPSNVSPADGATNTTLTPTLNASTYTDGSSDPHTLSTWRVYSSSSACSAGSSGDVLNTTSTSSLTSLTLSSGTLQEATRYYWRVGYTNSYGNTSSYSTCTSFTTIRTTPTFTGTIPSQTWNEDATQTNAFDLDTYFSDAEGESLTFSVLSTDTPDQITVTISVNGEVTFTPASNYYGSDSVTLRACDTDNQCTNSNIGTLTVSAVNDSPVAVASGFSPCCQNTTTDLTPTISWTASTDVDNTAAELTYEVRLGLDPDPTTTYLINPTSVGQTTVAVISELEDETTYYYAIRTQDTFGSLSGWSAIQEFYVNTENVPELSVTKQGSVGTASWFFQMYQWFNHISYAVGISPVWASHEAYIDLGVEPSDSQHYSNTGNQVVSSITPLGAAVVMVETLIGIFVLAFAVALVVLVRQSHKPKQFLALLFGNPASTFFDLFMGDNVTIEAISYAHFKAKLQLTRLLLVATAVGVAALAITHTLFAPQSPIAAKLTSEIAAGDVEPLDIVTITLSYENSGDGDATSAVLTDNLPTDTTFVSGSGSVNGVARPDDAFFSGSQVSVSLGTIEDRDSEDNSGTVQYQIQLDNPFTNSRLSLGPASLTANELSSPEASNSLSFDVIRARAMGAVVNGETGDGVGGVELTLSQEGSTLTTDVTTSSGAYSFTGLGDGTYVISVESVDGYEDADNRRFTVDAGDSMDIDFELTPIVAGGEEPDTNTNGDENINANENTNSDTNANTNENENLNTEQPDEGPGEEPEEEPEEEPVVEPIDDDLSGEFPVQPELTPEQEELKQDLTDSLSLISINDTPVSNQVVGFLGANSLAGLPSEYADAIEKILLPGEDADVVLSGITLPNSQVTITICSEAYVQVTQSDDSGAWNMVVPRTLFEEGEHVAVAAAEKDGVSTDDLEIARFIVLDEPVITSRSALVIGLNVLLLALFTNLVIWGAKRSRVKQTDPLLPEFTPSPVEQKHNRKRFKWSFGLYALAIVCFVLVFFIPHPRLFNMQATMPSDAEKIVLTAINQQRVVGGVTQTHKYVSILHLEGLAPADTEIAITLCPGVTFRSTASGPNGEWAMDIPLIVLPKGQFNLMAQFDDHGVLGVPHTIAEFKIKNIQILPRDWTLYSLSFLFALMGSLALWVPLKKEEVDLPPDLEPSDIASLD